MAWDAILVESDSMVSKATSGKQELKLIAWLAKRLQESKKMLQSIETVFQTFVSFAVPVPDSWMGVL